MRRERGGDERAKANEPRITGSQRDKCRAESGSTSLRCKGKGLEARWKRREGGDGRSRSEKCAHKRLTRSGGLEGWELGWKLPVESPAEPDEFEVFFEARLVQPEGSEGSKTTLLWTT